MRSKWNAPTSWRTRTDGRTSHNTSSPPPLLLLSLSDRGRGTSQDRKGKDTSEWGTLTSWRARMDEQVWDQVREFKGVGLTFGDPRPSHASRKEAFVVIVACTVVGILIVDELIG